ncbi:MAG: hypothetical protein RSB38_09215, partial [Oscillospiraceae bacterium]
DGQELLFNNIADPLQLDNLADNIEYLDLKNELKDRMLKKMAKINDTFECNTYYEKNWIENRLIMRTATLND